MAPELRRLVEPCLAKDPAQRPTPAQILDFLGPVTPGVTPWPPAVQALIGTQMAEVGQVLAVPPESSDPSVAAPGKRRRWVWVTAALSSVAILGGGTVVAVRLNTADQQTDTAATPSASHQPPTPFTLDDLREIDPCKLLKRDSLPKTGPVKPPEMTRLDFERCGYSTDEGADKTASRTVDIKLYDRMTQQGGTAIEINDLHGFKKIDGIYCVVAVENPYAHGFALTASSGRETGDPCVTPTEAMSAILLQIQYGTDARYQLVPGSALTTDPCAATEPPPIPQGSPNKFNPSLEKLHECLWTGQKDLGSYTVALQSGSGMPGTDGQDELDGTRVSVEIVTSDPYPPSCKIVWKHRQIDESSTEEMQVEYMNFDKQLSNKELCDNTKQYARRVLAKIPPVK
jgi:hypothetical protein